MSEEQPAKRDPSMWDWYASAQAERIKKGNSSARDVIWWLTAGGNKSQDQTLKQALAALTRYTNALLTLEDHAWTLQCKDDPTGAGDRDVYWLVIEHYMSRPTERVIGEGPTIIEAVEAAKKRMHGKPTNNS